MEQPGVVGMPSRRPDRHVAGLVVQGVEKVIEALRHDRAGNPEHRRRARLKPLGAQALGQRTVVPPSFRQSRALKRHDADVVRAFDFQQLKVGGGLVRGEFEMDQRFEHRQRRALCQVDDGHAAHVPSAGAPSAAHAPQVGVVTDSPKYQSSVAIRRNSPRPTGSDSPPPVGRRFPFASVPWHWRRRTPGGSFAAMRAPAPGCPERFPP